MNVPTRIARTQQTLLFGLVLVAACVSAGTREPRTSPLQSVDRDVMTEADIVNSHASTVYEAIERSHPRFLVTAIDLGPTAPRLVFLNGVVLGGGLNELRAIPASSVREIRFVRTADAATGHLGGGILVFSKVGR